MEINFDEKAGNVLKALGMSEDRFNEVVTKFVSDGTPILEGIKNILVADELTDNEKVGLVFSIGSNFGQQVFARQMEEATKSAMQAQALENLAENPNKVIN